MSKALLIVIGILLVVIGTVAFFSNELIYRKRDTVVQVGPVTVTADTDRTTPVSPIFGGAAVVCGAVLIAVGVRKS